MNILAVVILIGAPSSAADGSNLEKIHRLLAVFQRQHGATRLIQDYQQERNLTKRKFVVGSYACPTHASGRLHMIMNAAVGAIVTNRTLLWQYCSDERICPHSGDVTTCDRALHRR